MGRYGNKIGIPLTGRKGRIITNSTVLPSQSFANATHIGKPSEITSNLEMGGFIYHLLILLWMSEELLTCYVSEYF